jgi:hypothetical protein
MSSDPSGRDDDLPDLLDDLEATLSELRTELREDSERGRGREPPGRRTRRDRRRGGPDLPRPPSVSDLLRFTEQYTLPTLISTLEATIRALELLRGTLRLVDPDRTAVDASSGATSAASRLGSGAAGVGREAISGVERALSELEAALADANVPEDRASGDLLREARDLSAEVRARLDAAQDPASGGRDRRREPGDAGRRDATNTRSEGVAIEVTDGDDATDADSSDVDRPEVDVEAELASIRQEVHGGEGPDPTGEGGGATDREEHEQDAGSKEDAERTAADSDGGTAAGDGTDRSSDDRAA